MSSVDSKRNKMQLLADCILFLLENIFLFSFPHKQVEIVWQFLSCFHRKSFLAFVVLILPDNAPEQLQISQLSADRLKLLAAEEDSIP